MILSISEQLLQKSPQGIVLLNAKSEIEFLNPAAARLLLLDGIDAKGLLFTSLPLVIRDIHDNDIAIKDIFSNDQKSGSDGTDFQNILKISSVEQKKSNWVRIHTEKGSDSLHYIMYLNDASAEIDKRDMYETLFRESPFIMVINDFETGQYLDVNNRFCREAGTTPEKCIGKTPVELGYIPRADNERMINEILRTSNKIVEYEFNYGNNKHSEITSLLWSNPFIHRHSHFVTTLIDITEKKKVERKLIESEAKFRGLYEQMMDAYIWSDDEGKLLEFNKSLVRLTGYNRQELSAKAYSDLVTEVAASPAENKPCKKENEIFEAFVRHKNGHLIPVEYRIVDNISKSGTNLKGKWTIIRDITRRVESFKELRESREELRALTTHLQEVREHERARISREIHDDLGYILTTIKLAIESYLQTQADKPNPDSTELKILPDLIDTGIESVRRIATELRPGILDHFGLISAIEWLIQQFRLRTRIIFKTTFPERHPEFSKTQTIAIFRIFQEALTNVVRHAQATEVSASITSQNNHFVFLISDNGKGFDTNELNYKTSLGLLGMKEWARSIDSVFSIASTNSGTIIKLKLLFKTI